MIKFDPKNWFAQLPPGNPVKVPLGSPVSLVSVVSQTSESTPSSRTGVWECTPGRWRRQVTSAEFCVFVAGDCTFEPDDGEPVVIRSGDALYFPANSNGVWEVRETARKIYIVFDEPWP